MVLTVKTQQFETSMLFQMINLVQRWNF